jgi:hypothetical protein
MKLIAHFDIFLCGFVAGIVFTTIAAILVGLTSINKQKRRFNKIMEELEK